MKTLARLLLALLALGLATTGLLAAPAQADSAAPTYYRYWSYFHLVGGGYSYSDQGIGQYQPKEGAIEAFRYAATAENTPNKPRIDPTLATFDAICGDEDAEAGEKRVAVLIDFGLESDSEGQTVPQAEAECADVPSDATTLQVLQDVADDQVRTKSTSFGPQLCAIEGYPATGCAAKTDQATPADTGYVSVELTNASTSASTSTSTSPSSDPTSSQGPGQDNTQDTEQGRGANPWAYFGLGIVVFAILGGGIFLARRRRSS